MTRATALLLLASATLSLADDVLVVCPKPFRSAMKEWAKYREEQGYNVRWLDTAKTDKDLRKKIHNAVKPGPLDGRRNEERRPFRSGVCDFQSFQSLSFQWKN